ncbi:CHAD domain-containing protein [Geoalkalibacter halelectricus]|uniref:CHAD domain-containing protein n=1 Tax=Geoalkalibacter halelectricus TaxID=2847045 RepID=UPI003D1F7024
MPESHYRLNGAEENLLEGLAQEFGLVREAGGPFERTFFDSFDWRLYRNGWILSEDWGEGQEKRSLLQTTEGVWVAEGEGVPGSFAWDFSPGPLREALQPVLEMRALLPVIRLASRRTIYRVLDEREKTVLRLEILHPGVLDGDDAVQALQPRLILHPLKGFDKQARQVATFLERSCGLAPMPSDLFEEALAALGRAPADYSSKVDVVLEPGMPAAAALRQVLSNLLATLLANQQGVEDNLDSEFLHDFRVAVRRTRSALSQVKNVFPSRQTDFFRKEFAWLGNLTSLARDLDVYLLHFPDFQARLPAEAREDLVPFRLFLEKHQKIEYRKLVQQLKSPRFRKLISRWSDFLDAPGDLEETPNGALPIAEVAARRIRRVYRRVLREGAAISAQSPPEDLHELRKTCKKLRYLMEFFQSLYPPERIGRLIKALKGLQDNLGAYQDLHVQVETLRRFSREMAEEGDAPAETLLALGRLVEGLDRRQIEVREEFAERFSRFAREKNQLLFRELFKPQAREQV